MSNLQDRKSNWRGEKGFTDPKDNYYYVKQRHEKRMREKFPRLAIKEKDIKKASLFNEPYGDMFNFLIKLKPIKIILKKK